MDLLKRYIIESINEMPIASLQKVGNFNKPGSFSKQDLALLNNEKAIQKINKKWEKTNYDFHIYLLNIPALNHPEWREVGAIGLGSSKDADFEKAFANNIPRNPGAITILFNGNKGDEKVAMTSWIMAHRFGHAVRRTRGLQDDWQYFERTVRNMLHRMLQDVYNLVLPDGRFEPQAREKNRKVLLHVAQQIGTMRSARNNNLRNFEEFYYELFAQYLLTGSIKFNPLTLSLIIGSLPYGRKETRHSQNKEMLDMWNSDLEYYAGEIEGLIEGILDGCVGETFLM